MDPSGGDGKNGPLSNASVGGLSKKSNNSEDDPLTNLDTEEADGFAFNSGDDRDQVAAY